MKCVPNAEILNVYGPTEATIFCMTYSLDRNRKNKSCNGILCIGKAMENTEVTIINEGMLPVGLREKGELCLHGRQVAPGYLKNVQKTEQAFVTLGNKRYYRT